MKTITIQLTDQDFEDIKKLADEANSPVNSFIPEVIATHIEMVKHIKMRLNEL